MGFEPGDENDGFVKLVIDTSTNQILGAHIVGPEASILIQPFINDMTAGTHRVEIVNEQIASDTVKALRAKPLTRTLTKKNK